MIIILILPKGVFSKKGKLDYELIGEKTATYIYYVKENEIVGIPIYDLSENKYLLIHEVFSYLSIKSNSIDLGYDTCLKLNTKLLGYEIIGKNIYLDVEESFFSLDKSKSLYALAQVLYSYQSIGYERVFFRNNGQIKGQIDNYILSDGLISLPINLVVLAQSNSRKVIKVNYKFMDETIMFTNFVVDNDMKKPNFIIDRIKEFVNEEKTMSFDVINLEEYDNYLRMVVKISQKDVSYFEELIDMNFNNVIIEYIFQ